MESHQNEPSYQQEVIEYIPETITSDPIFDQYFAETFARFAARSDNHSSAQPSESTEDETPQDGGDQEPIEGEEDETTKDGAGGGVSKRQMRKIRLENVGLLKQVVKRPELVELHDVNSPDPQLLVCLKGYHNAVPVPPHWCLKRGYLQAKRAADALTS